jgi:YfiH family protein
MIQKTIGKSVFYFSPNLVHHPGLIHAISTRQGGVSTGNYKSLNLGFHVGDIHDRVLENHQRVSQSLQFDLSSLVSCQQVHDNTIALIDKGYLKSSCYLPDSAIAQTDALITDIPRVTLMTRHADCLPLLFFDAKTLTVAVAHAGWKGTLAHIGPKTVETLVREYKCQSQDIQTALGPSIGPCCYHISNTMSDLASEKLGKGKAFFQEGSNKKITFDLWQANKEQLLNAGIPEDNIYSAEICTSCNVDHFFSYRKEKRVTGRFAAFIGLGRY